MHHRITETQFEELFKPQQNHLNPHEEWNGWTYETYGEEEEYVDSVSAECPTRIWTVIEEDGRMEIVAGHRFCNRMGYIVTEIPFNDADTYKIFDCDVIDFDNDDELVGFVEIHGEDFIERFRPLPNHFTPSSSWFGWRYEASGDDLDYIRGLAETDPARIWAIDDDEATITDDWNLSSAVDGFIVTEVARSRHITWLRAYFDEDEVRGDDDE